MARFYATAQGRGGKVSRCDNSTVRVVALSDTIEVQVDLYRRVDGIDWLEITVNGGMASRPWSTALSIYSGPADELLDTEHRDLVIEAYAKAALAQQAGGKDA